MGKSVVIIGGGIAGLSAANELLRNGCIVTLLEAKERFGGRINTIHEGNLPIELGAEFIHGKSKPLLKAIRDAGLTTHEVTSGNRIFENGKLKAVDIWGKVGEVMNRINPRKADCSFQEFITQQKVNTRTRRLMNMFVEGFDAAHTERIGVHGLFKGEQSAEKMEGDWQGRVNEGYAALVQFFENEIRSRGGTLVKEALARRICWKRGSVEVVVHRGGGEEIFPAETALVTLPLGVWKAREVVFEPELVEKQDAADQMQFGNVIKIALVFRKQWWPQANFGFIHAPEEPIPTWWTDPRGPVLTGWAGGPKAEALSIRSSVQLETVALGILRKILGAPSLRRKLVSSHAYNWAHDAHVRGAYSYIPVNGLGLPKVLGAPIEGTLFFAGEATATDAQMGTVFGALGSGLRAAKEILKS